ncbi:cation diffusion facilitator family transporter [Streptomyces sp. G-G2]|uniref:cation diffusion facilitator family transporter n=1 Tax=Streptomyces sp. G-G2 TaxID=3046201 RepID=UPI0024B97D83|nr:cation diffusion facilitator family transporter [Streptomyces sp. G-G2]MDJ0382764.1 cation diffusion facilitator family transporter [Streptomyces sp. G-G2]
MTADGGTTGPARTPERSPSPDRSGTADRSGAADRPGAAAARRDGETRTTVWVALAANLAISLAKAVGGVIAASPALLSEAAHSIADSLNEVFLLASLKRSRRPADDQHPFGYGKERFFWSLLAAVGIFVTGGCFSVFQGIEAFGSDSSESRDGYLIGLAVLFVALLAEGVSLVRAVRQVRGAARAAGHSAAEEIRAGRDPALRTVLAEDSTACAGVLLAMAGMGLHMATGQVAYEACASILIGVLLVYVAYTLGKGARAQLIGEAADPVLQREVRECLLEQSEIDSVTALLTMRMDPDAILLAAGVDLTAGYDSETVEDAMVRIRTELKCRWPELDQVFLDVTDAAAAERVHRGARP